MTVSWPGRLQTPKIVEPVVESILFGFGYRSRSGKDSAVAEIIKQCGGQYDVRRYAFADELKREVTQAVDAFPAGQRDIRLLWDDDYHLVREDGVFVQLKEYPWVKYEEDADMSDPFCPYGKQRALLQFWGTEFRRNVNPDYWVTKVAKRLEKEKPEVALITDMRFPNEMEFIKKYGETVRVDRPDLPALTPQSHPSEKALSLVPDEEWTCILENNGTLEEFKEKSVQAFHNIISFHPKGYGAGV